MIIQILLLPLLLFFVSPTIMAKEANASTQEQLKKKATKKESDKKKDAKGPKDKKEHDKNSKLSVKNKKEISDKKVTNKSSTAPKESKREQKDSPRKERPNEKKPSDKSTKPEKVKAKKKPDSSEKTGSSKTSDIEYQPVHLTIEDDDPPVTVYNEPGFNYASCKEVKRCQGIGWLKLSDSKVYVIKTNDKVEKQTKTVTNPITGRSEKVDFIKVKFEYNRNGIRKSAVGWLDEDFLQEAPFQNRYQNPKAVAKKEPKIECPPKTNTETKNREDISAVSTAIEQTLTANAKQVASVIGPMIGRCPMSPPPAKSKLARSGLFYDKQILGPMQSIARANAPKTISTQFGKVTLTPKQIIDIDILARSVYGEMGGCLDKNRNYGLAVAKVVLNRTKLVDSGAGKGKLFTQPRHEKLHHPSKSTIAKVLTDPKQFSIWNREQANDPSDLNILRVMCPSRDKSTYNWKNKEPNEQDLRAWQKSLEIAIEAVAFPQQFNQMTSKVTQFYYTSGVDLGTKGYQNVSPRIAGSKINNPRCIWLWKAPPAEELND